MTTSSQKQKLTSWQQACQLMSCNPDTGYSPEIRADIIYRASCKILRKNPDHLPDCYAINSEFHPSVVALYKLQIIIGAVNPPGWIQDWNSWEQRKWSPWFALNKPGFRFYVAYCVFVSTYVPGGPRLALADKKRAEFLGIYCIALYRDLLGGGELAPIA